jgi:hypothetical protein
MAFVDRADPAEQRRCLIGRAVGEFRGAGKLDRQRLARLERETRHTVPFVEIAEAIMKASPFRP